MREPQIGRVLADSFGYGEGKLRRLPMDGRSPSCCRSQRVCRRAGTAGLCLFR